MVKFALNSDKILIQANDVHKGIITSKEFYCTNCGLLLCYVKESNKRKYICEPHFRHKDSNSQCVKHYEEEKEYINEGYDDIWNNQISDFYINWYNIFDKKNKFITIKKTISIILRIFI